MVRSTKSPGILHTLLLSIRFSLVYLVPSYLPFHISGFLSFLLNPLTKLLSP